MDLTQYITPTDRAVPVANHVITALQGIARVRALRDVNACSTDDAVPGLPPTAEGEDLHFTTFADLEREQTKKIDNLKAGNEDIWPEVEKLVAQRHADATRTQETTA